MANTLSGGAGDDKFYGYGGDDVLRGGAGDDIIVFDSADVSEVDGGSGTDTLRVDGSGASVDLTQIADGVITGIERIDLTGTGNNSLNLNLTDLLALSDHSNTLTVIGDAGDSVSTADSGWTSAGPVDLGGVFYDSYTQGLATLLADQAIDQTGIMG